MAPTSFVVTDDVPPELAQFAVVETQDTSSKSVYVAVGVRNEGNNVNKCDRIKGTCHMFANAFHARWKNTLRTMMSSEKSRREHPMTRQQLMVTQAADAVNLPETSCEAYFATTGAIGIVDLGASQTVVGEHQVKDLIDSLPELIRKQVQRTSCHLTFRFGTQQTPTSRHALLLPLGNVKFRIARVPGKTPFLLSSSFLKDIKAIIDTEQGTLWSRTLNKELRIHQSNKNLFLMDICQLWNNPEVESSSAVGFTCLPETCQKPASESSVFPSVLPPRS